MSQLKVLLWVAVGCCGRVSHLFNSIHNGSFYLARYTSDSENNVGLISLSSISLSASLHVGIAHTSITKKVAVAYYLCDSLTQQKCHACFWYGRL